jgi:hypothetical protein
MSIDTGPNRQCISTEQLCQRKRRGGSQCTDGGSLPIAAKRPIARISSFDVAERKERGQRHGHRGPECAVNLPDEKIGTQRNHPSGDVRSGDRQCAAIGPSRVGLLQAQLEFHHEIDPAFPVAADGGHDRLNGFLRHADDDIAHDFRGGEMLLDVRYLVHDDV